MGVATSISGNKWNDPTSYGPTKLDRDFYTKLTVSCRWDQLLRAFDSKVEQSLTRDRTIRSKNGGLATSRKKPVTRKQVVAGTRTGVSPPWWCVRGAGRWRSCRSKPWEEPSWPDAEDSERFQSLKNLRRPFEGPAIGGGKDGVREESREEACLPSGRVQSR